MEQGQKAWESFLKTGKIDDYMTYCTQRKEELCAAPGGGSIPNAADNERRRPQRQKDGG